MVTLGVHNVKDISVSSGYALKTGTFTKDIRIISSDGDLLIISLFGDYKNLEVHK